VVKICEAQEPGTYEILKFEICEDLEPGTCEILEAGAREVLIQKLQ
jgi:hypothetical protein